MMDDIQKSRMSNYGRRVELAQTGDDDLGPLKLLPGTWKNHPGVDGRPPLVGRGWNMIALPFSSQPASAIDYRLLMNQYNEELKFTLVDKAVPNRGVSGPAPSSNTDQFVVTLDYEQMIKQLAASDNPVSGLAGPGDLAIHHEPGLWLNMTNFADGFDIARLGTIPHGDAALALGASAVFDGPPAIPAVNGLPIGVTQDVDGNPYLSPYKFFRDNPFKGIITDPAFPGFSPVAPHLLLVGSVPGTVIRTTKLEVSTAIPTGGIRNIPFIVKQADAVEMVSIFWIQELAETDVHGHPRIVLQYLQIVMLDFFPRRNSPGLIRWPHISINTLEKVDEPNYEVAQMPSAQTTAMA